MATGVPGKNNSVNGLPAELAYPGKKSRAAILGRNGGDGFECLHRSESGNRLYGGDNVNGLRTLLADPEVSGHVALVYIDPPFATKGTFLSRKQQEAYEDNLCGAEFIESLRERLFLIRELLADTGSIYLHLDENMIFEMKLVMDEVFGPENYRNMIVRKKCNPKNYTRKAFGNVADFILFYTKSERYVWNRPVEPLSEQSHKEYRYVEPETGRRFMKVPVHAPGTRNGATGQLWRGVPPPPGKHWQYTPETLDAMDARGEIFWSANNNPRRKIYLDEHEGVGIQDIWLDFKDAHNQNIRITGYPTEKNPDLLKRIIEASSRPGDLVLDCYAGSGTTLAAAGDLKRRWIGMDRSPEALSTILKRFETGLAIMGDFVNAGNGRGKEQREQPTLFDTLDTPPSVMQLHPATGHKTTTDFSVYVEHDACRDLHAITHEWIKRNQLDEYQERSATAAAVAEKRQTALSASAATGKQRRRSRPRTCSTA
jgi:adenine-specific DNA-methyltransferase